MNKLHCFLMAAISLLLLPACESSSVQSQENKSKPELANEKTVKIHSHGTSNSEPDTMRNETSLLINKAKFRYKGGALHSGMRVFDVQLNQWAVVTNEIVVVLYEDNEDPVRAYFEAINQPVSYHKLANAIYGLQFDKSQDLLLHYKALQQNQSIKQLELQLRYDSNTGGQGSPDIM